MTQQRGSFYKCLTILTGRSEKQDILEKGKTELDELKDEVLNQ
jgi:hypothetical protein